MWWLAAIAAVLGGISAFRNSQAQEVQLKANAQANDFNAAVMRQRADSTRQAFGAREEQQRRAARLEAGKRAAAIGESGTGFGGSNLDFDQQQSVFAELDALNIRYEGELEAQGLLAQSELESYYSRANRINAANVHKSRFINTAASALSSGMSVYGMGK